MRIVVLGGGSTGEHFVWALRRLDEESEITLVERRLVGGECSYWACIPTKTALRGPEIHAEAERSFGSVTGAQLDVERVFAWRDAVAERDDASQADWLAMKNVELVRGDGVVERPGVVRVGDRELPYDRLIIATGSSPAIPPIDGLDQVDYWTNREATEAVEAPGRLVVLGAGPVGCELGQFFQRVGSQVTIVEGGDRILGRVDAEAAALVDRELRRDGVDIRLGARAARATPGSLVLADGTELPFDRLLVATGRHPNTDGFEPLALTIGRQGIEVDERLRAADDIWAIGDVTGRALFTHVGKYQARVAAYDVAGRPARADYRAIPATIFTDPQVAIVGASGGGASATWQLTSTSRLSTYERPKRDGFVKVFADPERRILTGAVAVGPEAGEWLQQLALPIRAETPVDVLLDVIPPFPSFSEAVFYAVRELGLDL